MLLFFSQQELVFTTTTPSATELKPTKKSLSAAADQKQAMSPSFAVIQALAGLLAQE